MLQHWIDSFVDDEELGQDLLLSVIEENPFIVFEGSEVGLPLACFAAAKVMHAKQ